MYNIVAENYKWTQNTIKYDNRETAQLFYLNGHAIIKESVLIKYAISTVYCKI